jgi:DNA-binding Lrp family transcriptional regulator
MNRHNYEQNSNIEEKILEELQKNCRLSADEIGKKCGCSRYKVIRVMKKLEENNTIVGYTAVINPLKLNLKNFILLVKRSSVPFDEETLQKIPFTTENEFIPDVNIKSIATLYVHGNYDWVFVFTANDMSKAKDFCNKIIKYFNKYINELELLEIVFPFRMNGITLPTKDEMKDMVKIL